MSVVCLSFSAGVMMPNEQKILERMEATTTKANKYFVPLIWAASIVSRARKEGRIKDDFAVKTLIDVSRLCIDVLLAFYCICSID